MGCTCENQHLSTPVQSLRFSHDKIQCRRPYHLIKVQSNGWASMRTSARLLARGHFKMRIWCSKSDKGPDLLCRFCDTKSFRYVWRCAKWCWMSSEYRVQTVKPTDSCNIWMCPWHMSAVPPTICEDSKRNSTSTAHTPHTGSLGDKFVVRKTVACTQAWRASRFKMISLARCWVVHYMCCSALHKVC